MSVFHPILLYLQVFLALILWSPLASAEVIEGICTQVIDGDTIKMDSGERVRLYGIDAPEKDQEYGRESRDHLASMVLNKQIRLEFDSRDRYGRILGHIYVDGMDANLAMLQSGMAWHYKHYDQSRAFSEAEQKAKEAKLGLWSSPNPIAPWIYRHQQKVQPTAPDMYWVAGKVHNSHCKHYGEGNGYETKTPPANKQDGKCCGGRKNK